MNTQCLEKAVELGNMILSSETSLRLADAKAAFEEDYAAQAVSDENIDVKKMPSMQEYLKALDDYDNFANSVLEMLKQTIGYIEPKSGGCGGCGSHGKR